MRQTRSDGDIAIHKIEARDPNRLALTSSAVDSNGRLLDRFTAYHDNLSPPLSWTQVLDVAGYAIVVEDPDAPIDHAFVHWMIWNIPAETTFLPPGLPQRSRLDHPKGAVQGRNGKAGLGYFGPRPPAGQGPHHYHFELFALDRLLTLEPDATLSELLAAIKDATIAKADLVAIYEAPTAQ